MNIMLKVESIALSTISGKRFNRYYFVTVLTVLLETYQAKSQLNSIKPSFKYFPFKLFSKFFYFHLSSFIIDILYIFLAIKAKINV